MSLHTHLPQSISAHTNRPTQNTTYYAYDPSAAAIRPTPSSSQTPTPHQFQTTSSAHWHYSETPENLGMGRSQAVRARKLCALATDEGDGKLNVDKDNGQSTYF